MATNLEWFSEVVSRLKKNKADFDDRKALTDYGRDNIIAMIGEFFMLHNNNILRMENIEDQIKKATDLLSQVYQAAYGDEIGAYDTFEVNTDGIKRWLRLSGVDVEALETEVDGEYEEDCESQLPWKLVTIFYDEKWNETTRHEVSGTFFAPGTIQDAFEKIEPELREGYWTKSCENGTERWMDIYVPEPSLPAGYFRYALIKIVEND